MVYPADTIMRLLSHDKDIIGALTFKRWPPFNPIVYEGEPYKMSLMDPIPDGLVEVTATGTGCLMIKMGVFDHIDYPWFEFTQADGKPVGEDINFCKKLRNSTIIGVRATPLAMLKTLAVRNRMTRDSNCDIW